MSRLFEQTPVAEQIPVESSSSLIPADNMQSATDHLFLKYRFREQTLNELDLVINTDKTLIHFGNFKVNGTTRCRGILRLK